MPSFIHGLLIAEVDPALLCESVEKSASTIEGDHLIEGAVDGALDALPAKYLPGSFEFVIGDVD
jgi:hypothetical protein